MKRLVSRQKGTMSTSTILIRSLWTLQLVLIGRNITKKWHGSKSVPFSYILCLRYSEQNTIERVHASGLSPSSTTIETWDLSPTSTTSNYLLHTTVLHLSRFPISPLSLPTPKIWACCRISVVALCWDSIYSLPTFIWRRTAVRIAEWDWQVWW